MMPGRKLLLPGVFWRMLSAMRLNALLFLTFSAVALAAKSVEEIAAEVKPSVVKISQVGREGFDGLGTGFVVSADGLIATNLHVIGEARQLEVETADGRKHEEIGREHA
ncbi:MAG TPA: hypothetical protein DIT13_11800, partial [Verrucomicrobiales bacterium]|nr:hypothetical protein [Verrucomicrobiales bacterium]